jgi:hypothetical protein
MYAVKAFASSAPNDGSICGIIYPVHNLPELGVFFQLLGYGCAPLKNHRVTPRDEVVRGSLRNLNRHPITQDMKLISNNILNLTAYNGTILVVDIVYTSPASKSGIRLKDSDFGIEEIITYKR